MSFKIQEIVKWTEEIDHGKFDLFDRIFLINESRGKNCGLKVSVNFRRTKKNDPEMKMKVIRGVENLNNVVRIDLEFISLDGSGHWFFDSSHGLNIESIKKGYSCPRFESVNNFRKAHAMIQSRSITYTMTFNFELKRMVETPEPMKIYEKLYLDSEISDVKIVCKGQSFDCHKSVISCQSSVFKRMLINSDMVEAKTGEIEIPESPLTIENLLFFIYHDNLDENKITGDLMVAADKYNIFALFKLCVNYLENNLTESNAVGAMNSAYLTNQKELFGEACKFVFKHKLIGDEDWQDMKKNNLSYAFEILEANAK